jgi:hypothetical protein
MRRLPIGAASKRLRVYCALNCSSACLIILQLTEAARSYRGQLQESICTLPQKTFLCSTAARANRLLMPSFR